MEQDERRTSRGEPDRKRRSSRDDRHREERRETREERDERKQRESRSSRRDEPRESSRRDEARESSRRDEARESSSRRDEPKESSSRRDEPRESSSRRDEARESSRRDEPRESSRRDEQRNPRREHIHSEKDESNNDSTRDSKTEERQAEVKRDSLNGAEREREELKKSFRESFKPQEIIFDQRPNLGSNTGSISHSSRLGNSLTFQEQESRSNSTFKQPAFQSGYQSQTSYQNERPNNTYRQQDSYQQNNSRPNNVYQQNQNQAGDRQDFNREREARSSQDTQDNKDSWKVNRTPLPPQNQQIQQQAPIPNRRVPPPMIRESNEPLPPLIMSELIPLHERKSKLNLWDAAPPGYDGMSVVQVKLTGHFPPPGLASRSLVQMTALPAHLLPGYTTPSGEAPSSVSIAQYYKQARRMYVGGIPKGSTGQMVLDFLNATMKELHMTIEGGNPATGCELNEDEHSAYIEFRTSEEATAAISLDGIKWRGKGPRLHTKRPKEFINPDGTDESPHKITVEGIPVILNQEQIAELFECFGELKFFNLLLDDETNLFNGKAVCEYVDASITDFACQGLNGMELGTDKIQVQRSNIAAKPFKQIHKPLPPGAHSTACVVHVIPPHKLEVDEETEGPTRVIMILNMLDMDDLVHIDEHFMNEIQSEFNLFGNVVKVCIPKPPRTEAGKVFVEYETSEMAQKALEALAGRVFIQRTLALSFYDEWKYANIEKE